MTQFSWGKSADWLDLIISKETQLRQTQEPTLTAGLKGLGFQQNVWRVETYVCLTS